MTRAEDEWWETPQPSVGSAQAATSETSDMSDTAAVLWVPDVETRRGWREYYIAKPKPGARPVGFRR
jgi:hypothetical protein